MAVARLAIFDVTERAPIPKGARVTIEDYDSCSGTFFVEYKSRIYAALPGEISLAAWEDVNRCWINDRPLHDFCRRFSAS